MNESEKSDEDKLWSVKLSDCHLNPSKLKGKSMTWKLSVDDFNEWRKKQWPELPPYEIVPERDEDADIAKQMTDILNHYRKENKEC